MGVRRLLTGPVGPGSTFTVLSAAAEAAREGRSFALILPTRAAMEHARNELARRVGHCDPTRVHTFVGLAQRVLGASAPRLVSHRERDAFLAHTLAGAPKGDDTRLALRYRGFRQGLLHVFDEIESQIDPKKLARHLSPERALRAARLSPPRARRLSSAYTGYRQRFGKGRATESDLLQQAAAALEAGKERVAVPDLVLVDGFSDLTRRQRELLEAYSKKAAETIMTWPVADPLAPTLAFDWPDRVRGELVKTHGFVEESRAVADDPRPAVLKRIATGLFADEAGDGVEDATGLHVVRAASRRDEVSYALTRAREYVTAAPERRWTDVLVVVPDARRYRLTIEQAGHELGVPVRVRGPLSLGRAPLVQGALAFLRAAATFELRPLLDAAACPAFGLDPDEADRLARAARRRGLPAGARPGLWEALANELGGAAGRFLDRGIELGTSLEQALDEDPNTTARGCAVAARALDRLLRPTSLSRLGARPGPEAVAAAAAEVTARKALLDLLGDLARLGVPLPTQSGATGQGDEAAAQGLLARVEEEVRASDVLPRDRRRHVLHVVDAREARAWEAEVVFVLGLVEREFPRPAKDDLFLPEDTRRALSKRQGPKDRLTLKTAEERAAEELFLFYAAATRARKELWLLYPGFSASGTPRAPSRFVDAVQGLLTEEAWAAAEIRRAPTDAVCDDPSLLLTEASVRRFAYRRTAAIERAADGSAARTGLAIALLRHLLGRPGERARAAVALRRPWAELPQGLGTGALERVYSATELEAFATCPFRHFVKHLLGARVADDLAQRGLDALRRGSVVHGALQRIYADGEGLEAALEREFVAGAKELDIGLEEDAFRQQAREAIAAFVKEDDPAFRLKTGLEPWAHELAFGPETPAGALEIEAPELGGTISLRGQIDRIDVELDADGKPLAGFVTDYKLGGREVDGEYLSGMHQGDRLQIPVYLLALQRVFDVAPLGAGFHALGTRRRTGVVEPEIANEWEAGLDEQRVRLHRVPLERTLNRSEQHVRRIVTGIAQGLIAPLPRDAKDCDRCDAKDVCRMEPAQARQVARRGRPLPIGPPRR